ncbi:tetratricopeptide repeat protein [Brevundimonas faecalis]|uniref:Sel1 repeat family protein n=1 Tax=Brevundimonas faecalis TaxID=947378 RepID=A0ABV2R7X6_9CAUL
MASTKRAFGMKTAGSGALRAVACSLIMAGAWTTNAVAAPDRPEEEIVLACRIDGQAKEASISLTETSATYRFGPPEREPELSLSNSLVDLDYRRNNGAAGTVDEIVTFANGDTTYSFAAGFRNGMQPDPSALRPFGLLSVSRNGRELARLPCRPDSIQRSPDRLLARMRDIGRERASDGVSFPNYAIHPRMAAGESPPCEVENNVDTCWSRGVSAARGGDLRAALEHYDKSCAARIMTAGCYEAGKLYLQNRQLRDYARARESLERTCESDDPGQGPYACKYLGWMYLTGTGVERDLNRAIGALAQACFLHNDAILIDGEGCHFLGQAIFAKRGRTRQGEADADYLAYLSFAQGCTDDAETVCEEARTLLQRGEASAASWVKRCEQDARRYSDIGSCGGLVATSTDYEAGQAVRRQLKSLFRQASAATD